MNKQATFQAVLKAAKRKTLQFWHYSGAAAWRLHIRSWTFWFFVQILGSYHWTDQDIPRACSAVHRDTTLLTLAARN
jgi:hypothetical protein